MGWGFAPTHLSCPNKGEYSYTASGQKPIFLEARRKAWVFALTDYIFKPRVA